MLLPRLAKITARYLSGPRITHIKHGARMAIAHYASRVLQKCTGNESEKRLEQKWLTRELAKDLINEPRHVFRSHEKCKEYFCNGSNVDNTFDQIPEVLKIQVLTAANGISDKSSRLITDDTSNRRDIHVSCSQNVGWKANQ